MSTIRTLRDLVVDVTVKDGAYIEYLTKKSAILKTANVIASSDEMYHKYKQWKTLPGGTFRNLGAGYSDYSKGVAEIKTLPLKILGDIQAEDSASILGDKVAYFKTQRPAFMEGLGQKLATQIIYGTIDGYGDTAGFKGLHEYAKEYGNTITGGGTTGTTSIFVVKYGLQSGLVIDNRLLNNQSIFNTTWLNGGQEHLISIGGKMMPGYEVKYESILAWLSGGDKDVARYIGLNDSNTPTVANIDKMLSQISATADGSTFIYVNADGWRYLKSLKNSALRIGALDKDYDTRVDYWDGIPVLMEENILSTETKADLV